MTDVIGQMKKGLYNQTEDKILDLPDQSVQLDAGRICPKIQNLKSENELEEHDREYKAFI